MLKGVGSHDTWPPPACSSEPRDCGVLAVRVSVNGGRVSALIMNRTILSRSAHSCMLLFVSCTHIAVLMIRYNVNWLLCTRPPLWVLATMPVVRMADHMAVLRCFCSMTLMGDCDLRNQQGRGQRSESGSSFSHGHSPNPMIPVLSQVLLCKRISRFGINDTALMHGTFPLESSPNLYSIEYTN